MTTVSRSQNSDNTQPTTSFAKGRVNRLGYSQALDDAIWGPMPAYSDDPFLYERRMRARFAHSSVLERAGLRKKDINTNVLIGEVVDVLKAGGDFGNERYAWQLFHRRVHKYMKVKAENVANKPETVLRNEGAALGLSAECIEQILHTPSGKGGLAGNMEFYRDKMRKEAGIGMYETGFEPDIAAAKETMEAFEAAEANRKAAKQPSVLDTALPRDANGEPIDVPQEGNNVDDPATQALADRVGKSTADNLSSDPIGPTLETLTGADDESDEVIVWTAASLKDAVAQEKAAFHHFAREISSRRDPATVSDHLLKALSGIPLGICIAQNGIAKVCEVLQRYIDNLPETEIAPTGVSGASDDTPGTGVALPTSNATQDGPSVSEMALEHATSKTEKTMQSEGCVTTVVMINNLELKVTAWQGETPDQISENILNALEGLRKAVASEKVKSFAAVSDGRDTLTVIKRDGQILSEPIKERIGSQPLPPNATPITSAPSAQQAASGTSDVFMIKVGKTFKKDKDQIQFECNGFEEAPKYSSKDISALVKIVSGLRKMDGSVLTAADLTDGSKHPVKGKLNWKLSNDGKYTNVMGTEAA